KAFLDLPARDRRASAGINADDGAPVSPAGLATDRRIDHSAFPAHAALYDRVVGSLDLAAFLQRDERGLGPGVFRDDEHTRHDSGATLDETGCDEVADVRHRNQYQARLHIVDEPHDSLDVADHVFDAVGRSGLGELFFQ